MWYMCKIMPKRKGENQMKMLIIVGVFIFFLILISLQYTLNKVLVTLKKIETNTRGGRIKHDDDDY
jgi:hypothetical protein